MDHLQSPVRAEQCGQRSQLFDECLAPVLGYIDAEPEMKQNAPTSMKILMKKSKLWIMRITFENIWKTTENKN